MTVLMEVFRDNSPVITPIVSLVCLFAGVWYGDKKALSRYRIERFNAVAKPLLLKLDKFLDDCRDGKQDLPNITKDDFRELRFHMTDEKTREYQSAIDRFFTDLKNCEAYDERIVPHIDSPEKMITATLNLLAFVKYR